jgi:histidine triad (HIT) family protein
VTLDRDVGNPCIFCLLAQEGPSEKLLTTEDEVIFRTPVVTAFVASHWWPNNPGAAIVIPNEHYESIKELPSHIATHIHEAARRLSLAMVEGYGCEGISTRQHNGPAAHQEVPHFHFHIFPRYQNDRLYQLNDERRLAPLNERQARAALLKQHLGPLPPIPWPPRQVVCVGAIVLREEKILLIQEVKGHAFEGQWTIPWGVVDYGNRPEDAALNEVAEEAGLKVEIEGLVGVIDLHKPDWLALIFLCRDGGGEPVADGTESQAAGFFSAEELEKQHLQMPRLIEQIVWKALKGELEVIRRGTSASTGNAAFL